VGGKPAGRRVFAGPLAFASDLRPPTAYLSALFAIEVAACGDVRRHFWYHAIM
jgi:hypothetical protein